MTIFNRKQVRSTSSQKEVEEIRKVTLQLQVIAQQLKDTNAQLAEHIELIREDKKEGTVKI